MKTRRLMSVVVGLILAGVLLASGIAFGSTIDQPQRSADSHGHPRRDFMFQIMGVKTPNQGGHTLNLYFHYRYDDSIADKLGIAHKLDIADKQRTNYRELGRRVVDYLNTADLSTNPYWEILNSRICKLLKENFPLQAISCVMQIVDVRDPAPYETYGYRSSIETLGDIEPLVVPGPIGG